MKYDTIKFEKDQLKLIDQRKLPTRVEYFTAKNYQEVIKAVSSMVIRGAPAIGAAGAYGYYLAALEFKDLKFEDFKKKLKEAALEIKKARPTAVNLSWAVKRMSAVVQKNLASDIPGLLSLLKEEADLIYKEDIKTNKKMAVHGNKLVPKEAVILTHCNTGALATVDYGTALGVIREAYFSHKKIKVYADETRPRLQGARLTAFELIEEGIPAALIADSTAATLIRDKTIDLILVGADRIAANGDTANKIGTFMLSEIAASFEVPFYVTAPTSTIDMEIAQGEEIAIEERDPKEITIIEDSRIAPEDIEVYNPAFDITPADNISAIITEKGIIEPPFKENIGEIMK